MTLRRKSRWVAKWVLPVIAVGSLTLMVWSIWHDLAVGSPEKGALFGVLRGSLHLRVPRSPPPETIPNLPGIPILWRFFSYAPWQWTPSFRQVGSFTFIRFPLWIVCAAATVPSFVIWLQDLKLSRFTRKGLCPTCGFDLRGITLRCPECGTDFPIPTPSASSLSPPPVPEG